MQRFAPIIALGLALAAFVAVIYPAFLEASNTDVSNSFIGLFIHPDLTLGYAMRILCLFVLVACIYTAIMTGIYNKTPITIVKTIVEITLSENLDDVKFERTQLLEQISQMSQRIILNQLPISERFRILK